MPTAHSRTSVTAVFRSACLVVLLLGVTIGTKAPAPAGDHGRVILGTVAQTREESQERERETGHHLTGVRVFRRWDQPLIDADQRWAQKTGHTVFLSVKSRRADGSAVGWRDLANAPAGSRLAQDMVRQAAEIKRFGSLVYIAFNHEPDARASRSLGGPADFVAAWRRLVSTYRAAGVTNARYVWTMTDWAFGRGAYAYYPGDAYVDDIAADVYNWYTCRGRAGTWKSLAELIEPQRRFGLRHPQEGLMLLEWGSVEDPARPGRKAQWITDATRLFAGTAYRQYRAILHWDDRHTGLMAGTSCDFDYRTSPSALAAWRAMAASPVFATAPSCSGDRCAAGRSRIVSAQVGGGAAALGIAGLIAFEYRRRRTPKPGG
ncbi:MAG: hypothetical protein JWR24_4689 [Actinoallomurus sp.]|jgi:hypothetical protein|nr:hypothetical protein [Actinoallomurus sp.]